MSNRKLTAVAVLIAVTILSGCGSRREAARPQAETSKTSASAGKADKASAEPAEKPAKPVEAPKPPELAVITRNITLSWETAGKTKMRASASEMIGNQLTDKGTMRNAKVYWYDNGRLTTEMTAPRIDADQPTRLLIATGGVTVRSIPRKTTVKAQWLKWYSNQHKVIGNGGVTVTSETGTVSAAGLEADTELKTIKFISHGGGGSASFKP